MNDFEFQRSLPVGQYLATNSIIHQVDPRYLLLAFGIFLGCVTFTPSLIGLGIGLASILIGFIIAKIPIKYVYQNLIISLPFLVIIALLTVVINTNLDTGIVYLRIGAFRLSDADLLTGAKVILRFICLILGLSYLSYIMTTAQMLHGLEALLKPLTWIGIPTNDLIIMIQVTMRFLPLLALTAERVAKAQASRGAEWRGKKSNLWENARRIYPIILPLFLISLQKAENMALAMDARGYGILPRRTSMLTLKTKPGDVLFLLVVTALSVLVLLIR
jgi:energy-coupling factor transport system permease protein